MPSQFSTLSKAEFDSPVNAQARNNFDLAALHNQSQKQEKSSLLLLLNQYKTKLLSDKKVKHESTMQGTEASSAEGKDQSKSLYQPSIFSIQSSFSNI